LAHANFRTTIQTGIKIAALQKIDRHTPSKYCCALIQITKPDDARHVSVIHVAC
jgi:hypothetical protein